MHFRYDTVIIVVRGAIRWTLGALETPQTIETHAGDRIDLPRGTRRRSARRV